MNEGNDSGSGADTVRRISSSGTGSSPYRKKYIPGGQDNSPNVRNGGSPTRDPSQWRSYSTEPDPVDPSAPAIPKFDIDPDVPLETMVPLKTTSESEQSDAGVSRNQQTGLIIGDAMLNVDPTTQYEMQRKKERIMMQSLRRKQQAEENKSRIDAEARRKREEEAMKEEEKLRKKEEERLRKEAILEQFKMKKEMEKCEEEVGSFYTRILIICACPHIGNWVLRSLIRDEPHYYISNIFREYVCQSLLVLDQCQG